jgi:hypothetical protein
VDVTDGVQVAKLQVAVTIPTDTPQRQQQARPLSVTVRVRRDQQQSDACVRVGPFQESMTSLPKTVNPGQVTLFEFQVGVTGDACPTVPQVSSLVYTATYSLTFGNHFLNCLNADPAWEPPPDALTVRRTAPPQPKLEITAPGRETTLYIQHEADGFPTRPLLRNVTVRITGVTPDPTPITTFRWKIRVQYQTRTQTVRQTEVFWERQVQGGTLDTDTLQACGKIVGERAGDGSTTSCVAGGNILFEVRATVNGQELMASKEGSVLLAGNNPSQENVQTLIDSLSFADTEKATWLKRIACQESGNVCSGRAANGQRQFVMPEHTDQSCCTNRRQCPGEPVWNSAGDGGAGIMQITRTNRLPRPSPAEIWDWRANVEEGVRVFDIDKKALAAEYPRAVQNRPSFIAMVNRTNQWRRSQNMPELSRVIVPDYNTPQFRVYSVREPAVNGQRVQRDMLVEDTIRGFNGYLDGGQFGLDWHEFWLWTRRVDIPNVGNNLEILEVENEGPDPTNPTKRIAYAIWERIPANSRPQVPGDPNYVNKVRCADPQCMGQRQRDPLCP